MIFSGGHWEDVMGQINTPATRIIIEDFAKEIRLRRDPGVKPSKTIINFRTDQVDRKERPIYRVPINLLRYRKDNGRIASDVLDYERNQGILKEADDESQAVLRDFLKQKDPEKTFTLRQSIAHSGQREPAIITCDGFLINGNRRKMVLEDLHQAHPDNVTFTTMTVVILPGESPEDEGEGGPPTLLEIEKIENRYQLQSDGKSDYYGFDRALSIRQKIGKGLSLREQLLDDPRYANATQTTIEKAIRDAEKEFLEPLECVDRYLKQFRREGQYRLISAGRADPEGRWQAFKDWSSTYNRNLKSPNRLIALNIQEDEIGEIEEAAFDIIRLRNLSGEDGHLPKVHVIMRDFPKYCKSKEGKKEILKITEKVETVLPVEECLDEGGKPLDPAKVDDKWAAKYRQSIIYHTNKARKCHEDVKEKETPLDLLEVAHKKLTHESMDLSKISISDLKKAREWVTKIQKRAQDLETEIYYHEKNVKKLMNKEP